MQQALGTKKAIPIWNGDADAAAAVDRFFCGAPNGLLTK
jgi:hypothetical protein